MSQDLPLERFMLPERIERLKRTAEERTRNLVVVLDGVHDPHNLSAVVRSCEAFGLLDLHVIESQARFRLSQKVSQGADKWLDIRRWATPEQCSKALLDQGFELWAAGCRPAGRPVDTLPWENRLALVFGNEHQGESKHMRQVALDAFHIPMVGFAESLNISVAVGIALALAVRGRIARTGNHGDLDGEQQAALVAEWQRRSVRAADRILEHLRPKSPRPRVRDAYSSSQESE